MFSTIWLRATSAVLASAIAGVGGVLVAAGANAWDVGVWDKVATCESTNRWDINTGNGYYGGLQFSHATWVGFGGATYATDAHLATKAQQIAIARRVLYKQGPNAWPVCSIKAGLTKENGGADSKALPEGDALSVVTKPSTPVTNPSAPAPSPGAGSTKLTVDGVLGPLTIAEMQKWSGSSPDGVWGTKTSRALQTKVGATVTGVRDAQTAVKVQGVVGATADGVWGRQTTSYLQKYLNAR